jgi:hypothetical protein
MPKKIVAAMQQMSLGQEARISGRVCEAALRPVM